MLFELLNAFISFQGYINKTLAKKLDILIILYSDDIFIYTKSLDQSHVKTLRWVLDVLQKY